MTYRLTTIDPQIVCDRAGKHWRLGTQLGEGANACVYNATLEGFPDQTFALKVFDDILDYIRELNMYQTIFTDECMNAYKETRGLTHLGCPKLYGHGKHKFGDSYYNQYFIILDKLFVTPTVDQHTMPVMCADLLNVLDYIHTHGRIHGDIHHENIMTDSAGNFYLIDYGMSSALTEPHHVRSEYGNTLWEIFHTLTIGVRTQDMPSLTTPLFSLTGVKERWQIEAFVRGAVIKVYSIKDRHDVVALLGLSEKELNMYKTLYCENPHLPYYIDSGITKAGLPFLITQALRRPIEKEYIKDISLTMFHSLVSAAVVGLEHLHDAGYCHNNVCPENILFDSTTDQFCLISFEHTSTIQAVPSPNYRAGPVTRACTSLDSYNRQSSPRNDIYSLIWCMLYWAGLDIPWAHFKDPDQIQAEKLKFLENPDILLNTCPHTTFSFSKCELIKEFVTLNKPSRFGDFPNYEKIRRTLAKTAVKNNNCLARPDPLLVHPPKLRDATLVAVVALIKDALILGMPDDRANTAIETLKYTDLW